MEANPEQAVIDQIDQLVNESLGHGPTDDYNRDFQERCELCHGEWHGLPKMLCPGAYATPEQKTEWEQRFTIHPPKVQPPLVRLWTELDDGIIELRGRIRFTDAHRVVTQDGSRDTLTGTIIGNSETIHAQAPTQLPTNYIDIGHAHEITLTIDRDTNAHNVLTTNITFTVHNMPIDMTVMLTRNGHNTYTLTDLQRMRTQQWDTRTYAHIPLNYMPTQCICTSAQQRPYMTGHERCTQCGAHMGNTPTYAQAHTLCAQCHINTRTVHAIQQRVDEDIQRTINDALTRDARTWLNTQC